MSGKKHSKASKKGKAGRAAGVPGGENPLQRAAELQDEGDLPGAEALCVEVFHEQGDSCSAAVHYSQGKVREALGDLEKAVHHYKEAILLVPDHQEALCSLGAGLRRMGGIQEAANVLRRAVTADPRNPVALNELALALVDLEDMAGAEAAYLKALEIDDSLFPVLNNLGSLYWRLGKIHEAIPLLRRALELSPGDSRVLLNLGNVLAAAGLHGEAENCYIEAIESDPRFVEPYNSLAGLLISQGELSRAIAMCRKAIALDPGHVSAHANLAGPLVSAGKGGEAVRLLKSLMSKGEHDPFIFSNYLFMLHYDLSQSPQSIWEEHRRLGIERAVPVRQDRDEKPFIRPQKRDGSHLRIGYVSPDFKCHSVAFFAAPLVEGHDRQRFEVVCYSDTKQEDEWTDRFRNHADEWHKVVGMGDGELTQKIRQDRIDILVDLAGHTAGNRMGVFARRAAPVQVTYLGYPDTSGLESMDYRLTDRWADPEGMTEHRHTEKLVRLPRGFLCYRPPSDSPPVRPSPCLIREYVTFGSFNNRSKINKKVVGAWAEVLKSVSRSRMLIKCQALADEDTRMTLLRMFTDRGIEKDRVDLVGKIPSIHEHLALYGQIDIALDTFPYHGTTTTCEALWMGVPVVTCAGESHMSRVGVSLLSQVGLDDLVAHTEGEYVRKAVSLARNAGELGRRRVALRDTMRASSLMDDRGFVREVETAYSQMWKDLTSEKGFGSKGYDGGGRRAMELEEKAAGETQSGVECSVNGHDSRMAKLLRQAGAVQQKGKLKKAEELYRQILSLDSGNPHAFYSLGLIAHKKGDGRPAEDLIKKAIHFGHERGLESVELSGFHYFLGLIYFNKNENEKAVKALEKSIELNPKNQDALFHAGTAHLKLENNDEALDFFLKLLDLNDENCEAHVNVAIILLRKGRFDKAISHSLRGIEINKNCAEAYSNIGLVYNTLRRFDESIFYLSKALEINPNLHMAHTNIASAYKSIGCMKKAMESCNKSIEINPHALDAYNILGTILTGSGRIHAALAAYRKALEIDPGFFKAHSNLLFALHSIDIDPEKLYEEHRSWWALHGAGLQKMPHITPVAGNNRSSRLRIAYLSPDFKRHSVTYFAEPLVANHNKEKFEVVCYSDLAREEDDVTARFRSYADEFYRVVGLGDEDLARKIQQDRIDILVDLAGHTGENRMKVFARKPAPIQVTWLGYPNTTGLETMDYRLTDVWADPEGMTDHLHSERLVRLPHGFLCYRPPEFSPSVKPSPCFAHGYVTFGSFNNRSKITEEVIDVWSALLDRVSNSRLIIKNVALADDEVREALQDAFVRKGIDPTRLQLTAALASIEEHLALYGRVDIALDTFPYNGTTTTCEALWMGVPVVTLAGKIHVARVGVSLLTRVGLEDLVAGSLDDYMAKTVALAGDWQRLQVLRENARERISRSSLMDAAGFAQDVERVYMTMWDNLEKGIDPKSPQSVIDVESTGVRPVVSFNDVGNDVGKVSHVQTQRPGAQNSRAKKLLRQADDLFRKGKWNKAEDVYRQVYALDSSNPHAACSLGLLAFKREDWIGAEGFFRQAVQHADKGPLSAKELSRYYDYLGLTLFNRNENEKALTAFEKSVELDPENKDALFHAGTGNFNFERNDRALELLLKLVDMDDKHFAAHVNIGVLYLRKCNFEESIRHSLKAVKINNKYAEAYSNIGFAYNKLYQYDKSMEYLNKALKINPKIFKAHTNLAVAYKDTGHIFQSIEHSNKAIALNPHDPESYNALAAALLLSGRIHESIKAYRKALELDPHIAPTHSNLLFALNSIDMDPEKMCEEHKSWWAVHGSGLPKLPSISPRPLIHSSRLRVAYVSPDFKRHSVAYFAEPLITNHDKERFEIVCYSDVVHEDEMTEKVRSCAHEFHRVVGMTDEELVQKIQQERIDILVDLAGHTGGNRMKVFAQKPAPVQVTWLGYPNTTGLETMDYRMTDAWADPEGMTEHLHSEKLVRLPHGFLCYRPPEPSPDVSPAPCLTQGHVTFGSFNNRSKITDEVIDVWAALLKSHSGSRLMVKNLSFGDEWVRKSFLDAFVQRGLDPVSLELVVPVSFEEHLKLYNRVDIALDTFPYNGTTTTCEALWMGIPVIALAGKTHVSRVGVSLLSQVGLYDLVADSADEYVGKAVTLAGDHDRLQLLRQSMRERMQGSPLMDAVGFARDVERVYLAMWENLEKGIDPKIIPKPMVSDMGVRPKALDEGLPAVERPSGMEHPKVVRLIRQADGLLQKGKLKKAEELYRQVLSPAPDHPHALYSLGLIACEREDWGKAEELLQKAVQFGEERSLAPQELSLYYGTLDRVLKSLGRLREALGALDNALKLAPRDHNILYNMGNRHFELGNYREAVEFYQKTIEVNENFPNAYDNMAVALSRRGRFSEALEQCSRAIEKAPGSSNAYNNRGSILNRLGLYKEAIEDFRQAVSLDPSFFPAQNNLGAALKAVGEISKALDHLHEAVRLNPGDPAGPDNLGSCLNIAGRVSEALCWYRKALEIDPSHKKAHSNLLFALQSTFMEPEEIFEEHRRWWQTHGVCLMRESSMSPLTGKQRGFDGRWRVGYVSPDFRLHSVAYFFEPLLVGHDRERVEVVCYSDVAREDQMTARLRSHADHWYPVAGMSDADLAQKIRGDGVHILVDLAGHTADNRMGVFAMKPAPVQVTWLGYPCATGLETMDYRLTDSWADPKGLTDHLHTEKLVRLPRGFLCYGPPQDAPNVTPPPHLTQGCVTFGSFNNRSKINETVVDAWSKILGKIPDSRLLVKALALKDDKVRRSLLSMFAQRGIDESRIETAGWLDGTEAHLGLYHRVDIALDTFPYNGTTTTCEALWMGVPVVTLAGKAHVSRVGLSLLSQLGLEDLAAHSIEEYVDKTLALAKDRERLQLLRESMRERMRGSSLMDAAGFARDVEMAYLGMWESVEKGVNSGFMEKPLVAESEAGRGETAGVQITGASPSKVGNPKQAKLLRQADDLYQRGKLGKAEKLYLRINSQGPPIPHAVYSLGMIAYKRQDWKKADDFLQKAIHLGEEQSLDSKKLGHYYNLRGLVLSIQMRSHEALAAFEKATELNPLDHEALYNAGSIYMNLGNHQEAVESYEKAIKINEDFPEAHENLAVTLFQQFRFSEALKHCSEAIDKNPASSSAYNNRGKMFGQLNLYEKAIEDLTRAAEINPTCHHVRNNLGMAFMWVGDITKALEHLYEAVRLDPCDLHAYSNLGGVFILAGMVSESIRYYRKVLEIDPTCKAAHSGMLFVMQYSLMEPEEIFEEHQRWWQVHGAGLVFDLPPYSLYKNEEAFPGRLRVGYISPDFRCHSVAYFLEPVLACHDKEKFEVVCYSDVIREDEMTARLRSHADHWYQVAGMSDADLARKIRDDGIHILVDLAGHTSKNRMGVFVMKPAPVQVSYLGYPGTTGLETMDYRFTDSWADPEGQTDYLHTEKLVRLPRGFLCYQPPQNVPLLMPSPYLIQKHVTFGSFNNRSKINEKVVDAWAEVLSKVPDSRLIVKAMSLKDEEVRRTLLAMFIERGVDPGRVEAIGFLPGTQAHLALYHRVDIALDTFPYNGTTTTCEALWMGVPVVTLAGKTHVSRVGLSILSQLGLGDLAAYSIEEYVEKAVALANNKVRLLAMRQNARDMMRYSSLMDAPGFARDVEAAYRKMWDAYRGVQENSEQRSAEQSEQRRGVPAEQYPAERRQDVPVGEDERDAMQKILDDIALEGFSRMLTQGEELFAQGRMEEARECFAQVAEKAHDASLRCRAFNNLGVVAYSMDRVEEAEQMFMAALSLDPLDVDAISNLSEIHKAKSVRLEE